MRWKVNSVGEFRQVTRFLWFPFTCEGECRWFEWATFEQIYTHSNGWDNVRWID